MSIPYKPIGYSSVSPYLLIKSVQAVIDFLVVVFGAKELRRFNRSDGSIKHVEVMIEDSVIMIGGAMEDWPTVSSHIHVYVRDVDAAYQRALEVGAQSIQAPAHTGEDPDKRSGVVGPAGNSWWISTQVE